MLGIASGTLPAGDRLPSIRALAARLGTHPNTIRAAYVTLSRRGWVELRKGSGAYVAAREGAVPDATLAASFVQAARAVGWSDDDIRVRVEAALHGPVVERVLVAEPEPELRAVLMAEVAAGTGLPVEGADPADLPNVRGLERSLLVATVARTSVVKPLLAPGTAHLFLRVNSVPELLRGEQRPGTDTLVLVASRSPELLRLARVVLLAAGIPDEALVLRDARDADWARGIGRHTLVITDLTVAPDVPRPAEARLLRVVAPASLEELRALWERLRGV